MKSLKLFNTVVSKPTKEDGSYVSVENGYVIPSDALWAKDRIISFYKENKLSKEDLNKTFHKSWKKIKKSSRFELLIEQITHYFSTYGTNFTDEIYIPDEVLNIPDVSLPYVVIKTYTKKELTNKALGMLQSGIALDEETIDDILSLLYDELDYKFTGNEGIRNKEAIVKIADVYGVLPKDETEFLRYILYRSIGKTLLIKDVMTIQLVKQSTYNPAPAFKKFGLKRLAKIFNRYKPLFLGFKDRCPKTINRISKLSKKYHKPMVVNPLNNLSSYKLTEKDTHWLDNATTYALFRALNICYTRLKGQDTFLYKIRNGKSWTNLNPVKSNLDILRVNGEIISAYLSNRLSFLNGKKVYLPENVDYALPTSEKMYVGNLPMGTKFKGNALAIGIYWENSWGARDLDLSAINIDGKIGWNSDYRNRSSSLMYSGDITSAPNGAVEYLYANRGLENNTLVMNNVYSGNYNSGFKIIVGQGDNINKDYMMNPEKLFVDIKTESVEKESILGIILPDDDKGNQTYVLLNLGAGSSRVSRNDTSKTKTNASTKALYQEWTNKLMFKDMLSIIGSKIVDNTEDADFDFSLNKLEKDSFTDFFTEKVEEETDEIIEKV